MNYADLENVPALSEIKEEFDLEEEIVAEVRKKILDKLESFLGIVENILQPEGNISGLHESNFFYDENRQEIIDLYKKMMKYLRWGTLAMVKETPEANAEFINAVWAEWKNIKEDMTEVVEVMKSCWDKPIKVQGDLGYLG